MTSALTPAGILAASLALIPLTANAGDAHFESRIDYITIVDASDIGDYLAEDLNLADYEGPVVVARTAYSKALQRGYILNLSFSSEAMGPMDGHPIFELVDPETLDGAPMFLTDSLTPKKLIANNDLPLEARDMAGILDMNYAADDVYGEFGAGFGEGDYLAVTHRKVDESLNGQAVFGAHAFDPSWISSLMIAEESGVSFGGDKGLAIVMSAERGEVAAGFEEDVKIIWLTDGPDSANHSDDEETNADQGADDGTAGDDERSADGSSSSKSIVLGDEDDSTSVGVASDLPQFTAVGKTPLRAGARFAPAIDHSLTLR
jgi:hypothetical protein